MSLQGKYSVAIAHQECATEASTLEDASGGFPLRLQQASLLALIGLSSTALTTPSDRRDIFWSESTLSRVSKLSCVVMAPCRMLEHAC